MEDNMSMKFVINLDFISGDLSDIEMEKILVVLRRYERLEKLEIRRIKKLNAENNKRKSSFKTEKRFNHCSFCNVMFIPCLKSFYNCQQCKTLICSDCSINYKFPQPIQICKLCQGEWLEKAMSGKWISEISSIDNGPLTVPDLNKSLKAIQNEIKKVLKLKKSKENAKITKEEVDHCDCKNTLENKNEKINEADLSMSMPSDHLKDMMSKIKTKYIEKRQIQLLIDDSANDQYSLNSNSIIPDKSSSFLSEMTLHKSMNDITSQEGLRSHPSYLMNDIDNIDKKSISSICCSTTLSSITSYTSLNAEGMSGIEFIVQGEILLNVEYISHENILNIKVVECRSLAIANKKKKTTNPYAKTYLLPEKSSSSKRKTKVVKNNINPIFNEILSYKISKSSLGERTLNVSVWHFENRHTNIFLGELNIPFCNFKFDHFTECWYDLKTTENIPRGILLLGLQFIPNKRTDFESVSQYETGKLNIFIRNGKYIGNEKDVPNSFVKCVIMIGNSVIGRKNSKVIYNTTNPIWNEVLVFDDMNKDNLKDLEIKLTVYAKKLKKNKPLGLLFLTEACREKFVSDCREKDALLWKKFINCSNQEIVEDYLPLRYIPI